ncbi:unnamed protein product [Amoebophrya sp. A25]|nr:unnamed protein product [Amoebophrya sp. A25]|eukprot:GSA25T00025281001.1
MKRTGSIPPVPFVRSTGNRDSPVRLVGGPPPRVSVSMFSLLVGGTVSYLLEQVEDTQQLEQRLADLGRRIGFRIYDLYCIRHGVAQPVKIIPFLQFVADRVWTRLFGHAAEVLRGGENEYQLADNKGNLFHRVVSTTECNLGSYAAGMVHGMLIMAGFSGRVTAHHTNLNNVLNRGLILVIELDNDR